MKSRKRVIEIITNEQIQNCVNTNSIVQVWVQDEYDKQGSIEVFNNDIIRIGNEYYVRNQCVFYTNKNYLQVIDGGNL